MATRTEENPEFGFSANSSPVSSNWQSPTANAMNVQRSSVRGLPCSESIYSLSWDSSLDQSISFQSSPLLSSMVPPTPPASENIALRELIGRLGTGSATMVQAVPLDMDNLLLNNMTSSWNPLTFSPKLTLSVDPPVKDSLQKGNFPPTESLGLAQFSADPGFAERAARFSCFGSSNLSALGAPNTASFAQGDASSFRSDSSGTTSRISRVQSNQSLKSGLASGNGNGIPLKKMTDPKSPKLFNVSSSEQSQSQTHQKGPEPEADMKTANTAIRSTVSTPASTEDIKQRLEASANVSDDAELSTGSPSSEQIRSINSRKRKTPATPTTSKAKDVPSPTFADGIQNKTTEGSEPKRSKSAEIEKDEAKLKTGQPNASAKPKQLKEESKASEPSKDYIHVRARRGQATDSHSLAERVRREKISERLKFLQDLVPGCNKVTGKAVMLDEIINYVQSLQRQVEFLSMKLATVNPRLDFNIEGLLAKDIMQTHGPPSRMLFATDTTAAFSQLPLPSPALATAQLGMASTTEVHEKDNAVEASLRRAFYAQIPGCGDPVSQVADVWDTDLHSVVQMGFNQNPQIPLTSQAYQESLQTNHMKIEL